MALDKSTRRTIEDAVRSGEEFVVVECFAESYNINFNYLCNFVLDSYNHYMHQGVDKTQSKVNALINIVDYCDRVYDKRVI